MNAPSVPDWFANPEQKIKSVLFGTLLGALGWFLEPIFNAISILLGGSQPETFAAPGETWGLADFPVALAGIIGDAGGSVIESLFSALASIVDSVMFTIPGPLDGVVASLVVAGVILGLVRYGPVVLAGLVTVVQAGLEAVPVVGGPLATLLGWAKQWI